MSGLNNQKELKLDNERKIALLKMFKAFLQTAPRGTQQTVLDSARGENKLPYNRYLKGAFSTHLRNPDKWYSKVPNEVYESIITTLKKAGKESVTDSESIHNIEDYFGLSLSLFVEEQPSDTDKSLKILAPRYWSYILSTAKKDYLSKSLVIITPANNKVLKTEEFFCYSKKGSPNLIEQKIKGYMVGKDGYFLFLQNDDHSVLPRIYILRPINYINGKCSRFVGKCLNVNANENNINILSRKIILMMVDDGIPKDIRSLIDQNYIGIFPEVTSDEIIGEIFDLLRPDSDT